MQSGTATNQLPNGMWNFYPLSLVRGLTNLFYLKPFFYRKGMWESTDEIASDVERTHLIKNNEGDFELTFPSLHALTFPSLHGTGRCLGKLKANLQQTWQNCVNPFLQIFEARPSMRLQNGCLLNRLIPRGFLKVRTAQNTALRFQINFFKKIVENKLFTLLEQKLGSI